jgi:hypothetical protein
MEMIQLSGLLVEQQGSVIASANEYVYQYTHAGQLIFEVQCFEL